VTGYGTFITSSKLFSHPDDPDEYTRGLFLGLNDIFSGGIEVRRDFPSLHGQVGASIEYIQTSDVHTIDDSSAQIPVRDGFRAIPIELTGYFLIPFGGDDIQITMGGGVGAYIGSRIYEYAGAPASVVDKTVGYGIHIASGIEYMLSQTLSLRSVVKFRDVQFKSVNAFSQPFTVYSGGIIILSQQPMPSRINIDGMTITLGLTAHF
jgi:hypothetical protein